MYKSNDKATSYYSIEVSGVNGIRNRLYMYENQYEDFENISNERKEELDMIIEFQKDRYKRKKKTYQVNEKLDFYNDIMLFLTHSKDFNIDEKLYILITACDSSLFTYHHFKDSDIVKVSEVKIDPSLEDVRREQIKKYAADVRDEIGFYDNKLVKYEKKYYERYVNIFNDENVKRKILGN